MDGYGAVPKWRCEAKLWNKEGSSWMHASERWERHVKEGVYMVLVERTGRGRRMHGTCDRVHVSWVKGERCTREHDVMGWTSMHMGGIE